MSDLHLYFASPSVEVWTDYRLVSALDLAAGIGGNVGLMMGMSVMSVLHLLVEAFAIGAAWLKGKKTARVAATAKARRGKYSHRY